MSKNIRCLNFREAFKSFNPSYIKFEPTKDELDDFKIKLINFYSKIQKDKSENEENLKAITRDFLKEAFYNKDLYKIEPGTEDTFKQIDLQIKQNDNLLAFFEFKKITSQSREMISCSDFNKKSLQEAIAYFLEIEYYKKTKNECQNTFTKNIIVTNTIDWFIFDGSQFASLFKKLIKPYIESRKSGRKFDYIYQFIISPCLSELQDKLTPLYFKIDDICNNSSERDLKNLYKTLHPNFLLNAYYAKDVNTLNENFYDELLYIMGLKEVKEKNKKLIKKDEKTPHSYMNLLCRQLIDTKNLSEKKAEEIALELILTWINRLIFIKLFESQLISFNQNEITFGNSFKILDYEIFNDFKKIQILFTKILGKKIREDYDFEDFENKKAVDFNYIPYLNSSLFEVTQKESKYYTIENIQQPKTNIEIYKKTNLKNWDKYRNKSYRPSLLEYTIDFLNSYSFTSQNIQDKKENSTIINASVLGMIFEKINGYKDGAYFTPSYITSYMSKQSIENIFLAKFNKEFNEEFLNYEEAKSEILANYSNKRKQISDLIDSLTICDTAVGSGHFLVSCLNQIIKLKNDLRCLLVYDDANFEPLANYCDIEIINDELYVTDAQGNEAIYDKNKIFSQKIQETLFNEKKHIIENCLFGVDINEKSVSICQLRLWIEMLKHAYYKNGIMETLPNIDIKIQAGNSLISYKPISSGNTIFNIKKANLKKKNSNKTKEENLFDLFNEYSDCISKYKKTTDKNDKIKIKRSIAYKKEDIRGQFSQQGLLNSLYDNSFEWAYFFPEIIKKNDKNEYIFEGFDIIIGNPPYIKEKLNSKVFQDIKQNKYYQSNMDIWYAFACINIDLLKKDGICTIIATNNWITNDGASILRNKILNETKFLEYIDFADFHVFDSAEIQTMIYFLKKEDISSSYNFKYHKLKTNNKTNVYNLLLGGSIHNTSDTNSQTIKFDNKKHLDKYITFKSQTEEIIISQMREFKTRFDKNEICNGIDVLQDFLNKKNCEKLNGNFKTGSGVFVLSENELKTLNLNDNEYDIIKPYYTPKEICRYFVNKENKYFIIYTDSSFKNSNKILEYPNIKKHLDLFQDIITSENKPYGLNRARQESIYKEEKILIIRKCGDTPSFSYVDFDSYVSRAYLIIKTNRFNLKSLTALLNSKLIAFWLKKEGKIQGDNYQIDKTPLLNIPLPNFTPHIDESLSNYVDELMKLAQTNNQAEMNKIEAKINLIIYKLYQLSYEQVASIDDNIEINEQDYNNFEI